MLGSMSYVRAPDDLCELARLMRVGPRTEIQDEPWGPWSKLLTWTARYGFIRDSGHQTEGIQKPGQRLSQTLPCIIRGLRLAYLKVRHMMTHACVYVHQHKREERKKHSGEREKSKPIAKKVSKKREQKGKTESERQQERGRDKGRHTTQPRDRERERESEAETEICINFYIHTYYV